MTVVQVVLPKKGKGPAAAPTSSKDPIDQGVDGTPDSTTLAHEKLRRLDQTPPQELKMQVQANPQRLQPLPMDQNCQNKV